MTKKDYIAIAAVIAGEREKMGALSDDVDGAVYRALEAKRAVLAHVLAITFKADNPRFDRDKFLKACDVT